MSRYDHGHAVGKEYGFRQGHTAGWNEAIAAERPGIENLQRQREKMHGQAKRVRPEAQPGGQLTAVVWGCEQLAELFIKSMRRG